MITKTKIALIAKYTAKDDQRKTQ